MIDHHFFLRVYYEDTDSGGIVYHANYLKFAERARTEWLRSLGLDQSKMLDEQNIKCVVHHLEIDFLSPARLDDQLTVKTQLKEFKNASMKLVQTILRDSVTIVSLQVSIACVNGENRPSRWPPQLKSSLSEDDGFRSL